MSLYNDVMSILKQKDQRLQEAAKRIVEDVSAQILQMARDRVPMMDFSIRERELEISDDLKKHLRDAGLQGFTFEIFEQTDGGHKAMGKAEILRVWLPKAPNMRGAKE
jgi:hypothetical protein